MVIFSSNTSYFSLYNYGLGHPTLCVNLSDSSGLDHSLGSRVIAVFSKRRCLVMCLVVIVKFPATSVLDCWSTRAADDAVGFKRDGSLRVAPAPPSWPGNGHYSDR